MKIRILADGLDDIRSGQLFYEQLGIGAYFLEELFSDIDRLSETAGVHAKYFDGYHRALSKKFPFAIYYRVDQEVVSVYAILDCRQNPETTLRRLSK